ncbi:MAG: hypothetical protein A2Y41_00825, partial [Spirochaetes bacterium GWB1_36_13]
ANFIITFRETLEAALVVGIVLSILKKMEEEKKNKYVYLAVISGIAFSFLGAFLFESLAGGFKGRAEQIFEGIVMLSGAFLITTMILWMMKQKNISENLASKVTMHAEQSNPLGIFLIVFIAILREGIETVIFLSASSEMSGGNFNILGAVLGIVSAIILGFIFFNMTKKMNLKLFFNISGILLILFAAGLVGYGVHELEEAKILSPIIYPIWDINWFLNEKGNLGSVLKGLFGYNGNPSLLETIFYLSYLITVMILWFKLKKK